MAALRLKDIEAALLARLAAKCAPGSVLLGTLDPVDLTDDATTPVVGKLFLYRLDPTASQVGTHARLGLAFAFSVMVDTGRADSGQRDAAFDLLEDAGNALVGWEITAGRELEIIPGPESGNDGRIIRLSLAFTLPSHLVGTP